MGPLGSGARRAQKIGTLNGRRGDAAHCLKLELQLTGPLFGEESSQLRLVGYDHRKLRAEVLANKPSLDHLPSIVINFFLRVNQTKPELWYPRKSLRPARALLVERFNARWSV